MRPVEGKLMDDLCAVRGGGTFLGGGGERKPSHQQQALKCPRCDSLNTKFCYYNNYNQSQPRYFCKSCRRYWTKGGVLRNVPVGGGNRKSTKRSKSRNSGKKRKSNSHSSSESSSLAVATSTEASDNPISATDVCINADFTSTGASLNNATNIAYNFPDSIFATTNPSFDSQTLANQTEESQIFAEIGSFTSMIPSSEDLENMLGFNTVDISTSFDRELHQSQEAPIVEDPSSAMMGLSSSVEELKMQEMAGGYLDQTIQTMEFGDEHRMTDGGLASALDWGTAGGGGGGDQGLFDVTGTVDHAYWSGQALNYLP